MKDRQRFQLKSWLLWIAGFLAFAIAGVAATAAAGQIDDAIS